jgi:hypothetical protein
VVVATHAPTPATINAAEVGKNKIVHRPTDAAFSFDKRHATFRSVSCGRAGEQLSTGQD